MIARKYCLLCFWSLVVLLISTEDSSLAEMSQQRPSSTEDQALSYFYQQSEYPRDCAEVFRRCPSKNVSSVYFIKPDGYPGVFDAYCDENGYTVIARRMSGIIGFNRSWEDYTSGFGFPSNEFWVGNQRLSYLTNQRKYQLLIEVTLHDGSTINVTYDDFRISDAYSNYALVNTGQFSVEGGFCYWGPWTPCSVTCDDGVKRRYCRCTDGSMCPDDTVEEVACRDIGCPAVLSDCKDVYDSGQATSGLYYVNPTWSQDRFQVYCNMADGGGWTVIQRQDGSGNFYRNWADYKNGFGSPDGGTWLGNDNIHHLTSRATYELRIDLTDRNDRQFYATYSSFQINDESDKYRLSSVGSFGGNAGYNALNYHVGKQFSTYDQDNDGWNSYDCAEQHQGGWWFYYYYYYYCYSNEDYCEWFRGESYCHACAQTHLNADYSSATRGENIFWNNLSGYDCGIQYTEMMIRPV